MNQVKQSNHRRDQRAQVTLRGRYMLEDGRECACRTAEISVEDIAIVGAIGGKIGERVVAYLDELGRVEGTIIQNFNECFMMKPSVSPIKRERLDLAIGRLAKQRAARSISRGSDQQAIAVA